MGRKRSTKDADLSPCEPRRSRRLAKRQNSTLCVADTNPLAIEPLGLEINSDIPKTDISNSPIYGSLQKDSKEIRILSLEPGKWDDPISCRLSTISLTSPHPPYETLSYVWEAERGYGEVLLDGRPRQVTKNLFFALRRLRIVNINRILWVDALCINQDSNFEKSHQVGLMKEIYKSCEQVYIWLGEYSSGKSSALDTRSMSETRVPWIDEKAIIDDETKCDPVYKAFWIIHQLSRDGAHFKDVSDDLSLEIFHALDLFASSPWWTRLWVVQELILPPKAMVLYGRLCILWEAFEKMKSNISSIHLHGCCYKNWMSLGVEKRNIILNLMNKILILEATRGRVVKAESFYRLLWMYRTRETSNPHDKVYGLLGLCADGLTDDLRPDYSITKQEVYRRATLFCLKTRKLAILYGERRNDRSIPSWVPDWSSLIDGEKGWQIEHMRLVSSLRSRYKSSLKEDARFECLGKSQLSIMGLLVDRVLEVGPRMQSKNLKNRWPTYFEWYTFCSSYHISNPKMPSNDPSKEFIQSPLLILYRLLTGDLDFVSEPQNSFDMFAKWWSMRNERGVNFQEDLYFERFDRLIAIATVNRTIFATESGCIGLGNSEVGDEIWVLLGGDMPFVLHPDPDTSNYFLKGDCFVHGIMYGEAMAGLETKKRMVVLS